MSLYTIFLFVFSALSATLMITSQRMLTGYNPYWMYVAVFGVATFTSLVAYFVFDHKTGHTLQRNWRMMGLAVALVGLNLGYVWLYQQDINLAYVPLVVTGLMTVFAIGVGYFFFEESFTRNAVLGMILIGGGVWLITMK